MKCSPLMVSPTRCSCCGEYSRAAVGAIAPDRIGMCLILGPRTGREGGFIIVGVGLGVSCATPAIGSSAASASIERAGYPTARARRAARQTLGPASTSIAIFRSPLNAVCAAR
jgi:hypothetical protein